MRLQNHQSVLAVCQRKSIRSVAVAAAVLLCAQGTFPTTASALDEVDNGAVKAAEIKTADEVFAALISKNQPPELLKTPGGAMLPFFPIAFDWEDYARVSAAIKKLEPMAEKWWPRIVEHMTDDEYCTTALTSYSIDSARNFSRGEVCYRLATGWLIQGYEGLMPMGSPRYNLQPPVVGHKELQKWCQERQRKKLYELQIEAAEWAISIIPHESNRPKEMQDVAIKSIQNRIAEIRKTRTPVPASFFNDSLSRYHKEEAEKLRKEAKELNLIK